MQLVVQDFGLNIVKNIIDMHKGTVKIDSTVNKGTKTSIHIPLNLEESNNH